MKSSLFYSKILLFGEYGIIKNSKGISIPYDLFKGFLKIGDLNNKIVKKSNGKLNHFYQYLVSSNEINSLFDLEQFKSCHFGRQINKISNFRGGNHIRFCI